MADKTTFIIGAGASAELGISPGFGLKKDIGEAFKFRNDDFGRLAGGDDSVRLAFKVLVESGAYDRRRLFDSANHITTAIIHQPSIDTFIDSQRDVPEVAACGKIAIVSKILQYESQSKIRHEDPRLANKLIDFSQSTHWLHYLFQILTDSRSLEEFRDRMEQVTFIVFNYDRCLQHFFFQAIQNLYRISREDAAKAVDEIKIVHPYGYVGRLPVSMGHSGIEFGLDASPHQIVTLSESIRTFTEQIDDDDELAQIRRPIAEATKLVFLGFGFHHQNLQLLLPDREKQVKQIYGSGWGMSDTDIDHAKSRLSAFQRAPGMTIDINPRLKASEFLTQYRLIIGA